MVRDETIKYSIDRLLIAETGDGGTKPKMKKYEA